MSFYADGGRGLELLHFDVSSAGVLDSVADEELLKRVWAVIDSFRHVQHEVVHGVLEWLPTVLDFFRSISAKSISVS